jgi:enterochelin esterase family protein
MQGQSFPELLPSFRPNDSSRKLLWMVCGRDDELAAVNRQLATWLHAQGAVATFEEQEGTHSYIVWREGLVHFASAIF